MDRKPQIKIKIPPGDIKQGFGTQHTQVDLKSIMSMHDDVIQEPLATFGDVRVMRNRPAMVENAANIWYAALMGNVTFRW